MVSTSFAAWDYFTVIGDGEGQATYGRGSMEGFKIRYGLMENLEIFATNGDVAGIESGYFVGARYQILPEMLALSLDVGIPYTARSDFGLVPGLSFTMGINDMISFGIGAELGVALNHADNGPTNDDDSRLLMNLNFGVEFGFQITEAVGVFLGCAIGLPDFTSDPSPDATIDPWVGVSFTVTENLSLATMLGIDLNDTNRKNEDAIAFKGGVEFTISF